ncbi:MAG: transporter substrate-binding domain-containing protein [Hydrogenophaga sp.]|uniref:transporter substrate-binding domain-containing protein n=1 Tax=Comamonadaceae TaxID=80864 RepID=UPI00272F33AA|nr:MULTISPECIES: transporter substrate-binding domain-containing protein [Comamonadaceae]MDP2450477.1 transporter substrate-binding domain-containing protein [Polaromonas sp.]MDZ4188206.1 transporter substrate-binding domain-containing protein [Hydrogenophaga sp.]
MNRLLPLFPCLLMCATLSAQAQTPVLTTLQKISQTATINLGHRESSVPFSYYDDRRQVVGYSHDLMLAVTESIQKELKLPALAVKLVPVTSQNRIPLVQNGSVDLECGSTTHNRERARQVAFSVSIFQTSSRLLTHKDSGVAELADLKGRRVLVTAGTTSERQLMLHSETQGLRFDIESAKDHGQAFAQLQSGRAEAFMMDDAVLYGLRAKADRPDDWRVVGQPMAAEVYACMLRKDDPAFKAVVDRSLTQLMQSGAALKIFRRWFQSPIPPKGLNLNWPAPDALLELYRTPNDRPLG